MNKKTHLLITLLLSFFMLSSNVFGTNIENMNGERSLVEILDDFATTYNVFFSYEKAMIEDVKVDFDIDENEALNDAMDRLLTSQDLDYEIIGEKYIAVFQKSNKSDCLLYTSPSPRDATLSRMPSSA